MTDLIVGLANANSIIIAVNYWSNLLISTHSKAMGMTGYISI